MRLVSGWHVAVSYTLGSEAGWQSCLLDNLGPDASRRSACLAGLRGWGTSDWARPVLDKLGPEAGQTWPAGGLLVGLGLSLVSDTSDRPGQRTKKHFLVIFAIVSTPKAGRRPSRAGSARTAPSASLASSKSTSNTDKSQQSFFVIGGKTSHVYMQSQDPIAVFVGVTHFGEEAIVDTAAQDGVIGSTAFKQLRAKLRKFGIRPIKVPGKVPECVGVGGSAKALGVFDIPIGVANVSGVLRTTVLQDGESTIPFLLPVTFHEVTSARIDFDRNTLSLKHGSTTPMRRLESGHRAVRVLDFKDGVWEPPMSFFKDGGVDPFRIPTASSSSRKVRFETNPDPPQPRHPHFALDLTRTSTHDQAATYGTSTAVQARFPEVYCIGDESETEGLEFEIEVEFDHEWSELDLADSAEHVVREAMIARANDTANQPPRSFGKHGIAACSSSEDGGGVITDQERAGGEEEDGHGEGVPSVEAADVSLGGDPQIHVDGVGHGAESEPEKEPKKITKEAIGKTKAKPMLRRAIGSPMTRSKAQRWKVNPLNCEHKPEDLKQRGTKDCFWWTCTQCAARWKRLMWEGDKDQAEGTKPSSSSSSMPKGSVAYPAVLPPPRSRPDLPNLSVKELSKEENLNTVEEAQGKTQKPRALSGTMPARSSSRPRTPRMGQTEIYEIAHSDEDNDFDMVNDSPKDK